MNDAVDDYHLLVGHEVARVREALPPLGARVPIGELARRAGLDEDRTTRRLGVLCAAGEALLDRGWVTRRAPARLEGPSE